MMPMNGGIPMDNEMPMDNGAPVGNEMPMGDNRGSEFDTNFDAGVEADEDEDPKKYIQQLTGKLSQELGKYNNELGEPDVELSKYVGGMITKQVAKYLDDSGKKELIKKIKTTDSSNDSEVMPMDDNMENEMPEDDNMPMESYSLSKKNLTKIFESFKNNYTREDETKKVIFKRTKTNKPFTTPKFK